MAGNKDGGRKAAETNIKRHGEDFYKVIGQRGGKKTHADGSKPKGFAAMPVEKRVAAGRKGGAISRKGGKDEQVE